jgi:hypothetical protein
MNSSKPIVVLGREKALQEITRTVFKMPQKAMPEDYQFLSLSLISGYNLQ